MDKETLAKLIAIGIVGSVAKSLFGRPPVVRPIVESSLNAVKDIADKS